MNETSHRPIRSFVMRAGRMTVGQARALEELWPRYGVEYSPAPVALEQLFGRQAPRTLEIGFGNGEHLASLAASHPERDYFGIEVHRPGVGHLLMLVEKNGLTNLRASSHDAVEVLRDQVTPGSLDEVLLLFPDPWHKKRHHKRRLVQPAFAALAARKLAPGGVLHAATDWPDYAEHMDAILGAEPGLERVKTGLVERPATKFESRGRKLGHPIRDLYFARRRTAP